MRYRLRTHVRRHTVGQALSVACQGDYAYLANDHDGLRIYDISDPHSIIDPVGKITEGGRSLDVAVGGTVAAVAIHRNGVQLYDVTDPLHAVLATTIPSIDCHGAVYDVLIVGNHLFTAAERTTGPGITIWDISDPSSPLKVKDLNSHDGMLTTHGNILAIAAGPFGVQLFDISTPSSPIPLYTPTSILDDAYASEAAIDGSLMAVALREGGIGIYDISTPTSPGLLHTIQTDDGSSPEEGEWPVDGVNGIALCVALEANRLYASVFGVGMIVYDVSTPTTPVEVRRFRSMEMTCRIALHRDYAWWANGDDGLRCLLAKAVSRTVSIERTGDPGNYIPPDPPDEFLIERSEDSVRYSTSNPLPENITNNGFADFDAAGCVDIEISPAFSSNDTLIDSTISIDALEPVEYLAVQLHSEHRPAIPGAENVGDGILGSVLPGPSAIPGTYTLECTDTAVDGGTFSVHAPDGQQLDDAIVGTKYDNGHLTFTITAGDTDFAIGDTFTAVVTDESFAIEWSDDNANWSIAATFVQRNSGNDYHEWSSVGAHRYWRLRLTAAGAEVTYNGFSWIRQYVNFDGLDLSYADWAADVPEKGTWPPSLISRIRNGGLCYSILPEGNNLWACNYDDGVRLYDNTDIENPIWDERLRDNRDVEYPPTAIRCVRYGDYLYVASRCNAVEIWNVSVDPAVMIRGENALDLPIVGALVTDVKVSGTTLMVATIDHGIRLYSLSNPEAPAFLGATPDETVEGITIDGTTVYAALGENGLAAFDISTPTTPVQLFAEPATSGQARHAWVSDTHIYLACGDAGVLIYEIVAPDTISLVATAHQEKTSPLRCTLNNSTLWVAAYNSILIYDVTTPSTPRLLLKSYTGGAVRDITSDDTGNIYVADEYGFARISIEAVSENSNKARHLSHDYLGN